MTTDPIAAAIDHIRSITPADGPWTPAEFETPGHDPTPTDRAIAMILNAVSEGQLINRASRDEMLAQVRRGEVFASAGAEGRWIADSDAGVYDADSAHGESKTGYWAPPKVAQDEIARLTAEVERLTKGSICEVAATNPSVMEYMRHWEGRAEKAETERDTLVAAAYEAAAEVYWGGFPAWDTFSAAREAIRTLTPSDAQAALDKLLAEARLEGWRAGREAAAEHCWAKRDLLADAEQKQVAAGLTGCDYYGRRLEAELLSRSIRALPEGG